MGGPGVTCGQTFDGQVAAGGDDGYWENAGSTFDSGTNWNYIGNVNGDYNGFFRVDNVTVPNGATIEAATFDPYHYATGDDGSGTKSNVYMEAADDPAAPTTHGDADGRATTTAFTAWDDKDFSAGFTESLAIAAVVQEIVDRGGWASGQAMLVLWKDDTSNNFKIYQNDTYDSASARGAKLHIQYCA